jgi:hypothetical protein
MAKTPTEPAPADLRDQPAKGFRFLPAYADLIAEGTNRWSYLEYYLNSSIWLLTGDAPAVGACQTSQMYTANAKLSALLSLLKLRKADQVLIDRVNKFASNFRDALEARNRIDHDVWLNDTNNPDQMAKLRITADKVLRFGVEAVPLEQLRTDVAMIDNRRLDMGEIREAIRAALPTLPQMSLAELHPITETPKAL